MSPRPPKIAAEPLPSTAFRSCSGRWVQWLDACRVEARRKAGCRSPSYGRKTGQPQCPDTQCCRVALWRQGPVDLSCVHSFERLWGAEDPRTLRYTGLRLGSFAPRPGAPARSEGQGTTAAVGDRTATLSVTQPRRCRMGRSTVCRWASSTLEQLDLRFARRHVELAQDRRDVCLHRDGRDEEPRGDLLRRCPCRMSSSPSHSRSVNSAPPRPRRGIRRRRRRSRNCQAVERPFLASDGYAVWSSFSASARLSTRSFLTTALMWRRTVTSEIRSRSAISRVDRPSRISDKTSHSRAVRSTPRPPRAGTQRRAGRSR